MTDKAPLVPWGRENKEDDFGIGYMCLVDFEYELGMASGGVEVYSSVEDLREHRKCVDGCGIVEVMIRCRKIVQPEMPYDEQIEKMEQKGDENGTEESQDVGC